MFINPTELNTLTLTALMVIPIIGALIIALQGKSENTKAPHYIAAATTFTVFVLSVVMAFSYWPYAGGENQYLFRDTWNWIPFLNTSYDVAVDGLSLPMVVLTTFLIFICSLASWNIADKRPKLYFALFLFLETALIGVFTSVDMLLFFVFWELELIPMYFLIGIWGGPRREYASYKFILYTVLASAGMFISLLAIYFYAGAYSFDYITVSQSGILRDLSMFVQVLLFLGFFLCFAVKLPVVPLHTWLPDAHVEAPTPVSVLLAGVLLKMGAYGLFRFNFGLFPEATQYLATLLAVLGVINIVYGAFLALAQTDMKKVIAYSSVSHMGFVLLGLASLNHMAFNGGILQMFAHGTITAMMFLMVGVVYDRAHTREIAKLGGLAQQMPMASALFLVTAFAAVGVPGFNGFVAEVLIYVGAFQSFPILTIIAVLGIILGAAYMLWLQERVFFGPRKAVWNGLSDMNGLEKFNMIACLIVVLITGILPFLIMDIINPATVQLLGLLG
ncbi:complex I subunit 4 family protein [Chrysiogenes arsenatis]|uniref:complex I subunit 4 family protein n=1 Tax=Chrysiogenes arsenatis TaxID=309797 RepID=UPI00041D5F0B|nr:NADH-quinone oxidoreductase subunit M [Chrysiogenes arsenatis]